MRHVLTATAFDFDAFRQRALADEGPGHVIGDLIGRLDARVVQPDEVNPDRRDRILAKVFGDPAHWAAARAAFRRVEPGDLVFCSGEGPGLAAAVVNAATRRRAKVATQVMAPRRVRTRVVLTGLRLVGRTPLLLVGTSDKAEFLERSLRLDDSRVVTLSEQVDERFFRPSSTRPEPRDRPLVASCGLEQRDYDTLARAVVDRDVDVLVCAASPNFDSRTRVRMPDELPDNMEMRHLEFAELRDLYQRADVTVISLLFNTYSAGLTALLEAMACGCPAVITRTPGLAADLIDAGLVWGVSPDDPRDLWRTLERILDDPTAAAERAERALAHYRQHFTSDRFLDRLVATLDRYQSGAAVPRC